MQIAFEDGRHVGVEMHPDSNQPIAIVLGGSCHREVRFGSLSAEKMSPCSRR
jgi:hypothetical protein